MSLLCPNALWAMDFQFDTTVDGRTIKLLNVIDEFTREALATETHRSIDADHVVAVLDRLCVERRRTHPRSSVSTTAPNSLRTRVADWCRFNHVDAVFIDPGSPWQNAWIESFNGRMRDELLNLWHFDSLLEAQVLIEDWRIDYNHQPAPHRPRRPHPNRVRPTMGQPVQADALIATGSTIGSLSRPLRL